MSPSSSATLTPFADDELQASVQHDLAIMREL